MYINVKHCGLLHCIVLQVNTGVSEEHTISIFKVEACRFRNCLSFIRLFSFSLFVVYHNHIHPNLLI
jgi:hypothetical protein